MPFNPQYFSKGQVMYSDALEELRASGNPPAWVKDYPRYEDLEVETRYWICVTDALVGKAIYSILGVPPSVNSFYRNVQLNRIIKGSSSSLHPEGKAVDLSLQFRVVERALDGSTRVVDRFYCGSILYLALYQAIKISTMQDSDWLKYGDRINEVMTRGREYYNAVLEPFRIMTSKEKLLELLSYQPEFTSYAGIEPAVRELYYDSLSNIDTSNGHIHLSVQDKATIPNASTEGFTRFGTESKEPFNLEGVRSEAFIFRQWLEGVRRERKENWLNGPKGRIPTGQLLQAVVTIGPKRLIVGLGFRDKTSDRYALSSKIPLSTGVVYPVPGLDPSAVQGDLFVDVSRLRDRVDNLLAMSTALERVNTHPIRPIDPAVPPNAQLETDPKKQVSTSPTALTVDASVWDWNVEVTVDPIGAMADPVRMIEEPFGIRSTVTQKTRADSSATTSSTGRPSVAAPVTPDSPPVARGRARANEMTVEELKKMQ